MKFGLAPLVCSKPIVLVLGSLPGDESIRRQEYYGNPRNMFWKVLSGVFNDLIPDTYQEKKAFLAKHKVALWDVFASAEREGSLDSSIRKITCNDIPEFLRQYPSIKGVVLNGGKAAKSFTNMQKSLGKSIINVRVYSFTSTSPLSISAGWPLERIIEQWKQILTVYEEV